MKFMNSGDMPADNIVELLAAHREAIVELSAMLPVSCAREGHKWDVACGVLQTIATGYELVERRVSDGDLGGHTVGTGEYDEVGTDFVECFVRTCTRCGAVEKKRPIAQQPISPFKP